VRGEYSTKPLKASRRHWNTDESIVWTSYGPAFYENNSESESDEQLANKYKRLVFQDLERQATLVEGEDSNNRTIVYKPPQISNTTDADEAFLLTQFYTVERAIAKSEFEGNQEKSCAIFNFKNYSSRNSPSKTTLVTLIKVLQTCYPERLGILTVLEPPFWMRALFNIVWPFLSRATADKIQMSQELPQELLQGGSSGNKLREKIAQPETTHVDLEGYTLQPFYSAVVEGDEVFGTLKTG
jgi:CRAL/TRIO domain